MVAAGLSKKGCWQSNLRRRNRREFRGARAALWRQRHQLSGTVTLYHLNSMSSGSKARSQESKNACVEMLRELVKWLWGGKMRRSEAAESARGIAPRAAKRGQFPRARRSACTTFSPKLLSQRTCGYPGAEPPRRRETVELLSRALPAGRVGTRSKRSSPVCCIQEVCGTDFRK